MALPGVAPLCPHCGGRRTEPVAASHGEADAVTGQEWRCRSCERTFWSLPTLGAPPR